MVFTYTTETGGAGTRQTPYTITVPSGGVVCDVLIVGGGGGGGSGGGGGGGGSVLFATNITLTSGSIRVGNGGTGDATSGDNTIGMNGSDSSITINSVEYIAKGGGGGGGVRGVSNRGVSGVTGGSGGGGGPSNDPAYIGYGGASNKNTYANFQSFGNAGGQGRPNVNTPDPLLSSGGGGGAGSAGTNYLIGTGGNNGGSGKEFIAYFGTNVGHNGWFGGDGGGNNWYGSSFLSYGNGGNGLLGGGGNGSTDGNTTILPISGLPNTGGGGGGGLFYTTNISGGTGGSGVVIIRYLTPTTSSVIELIRGTTTDENSDYTIGNYNGIFKVFKKTYNINTEVLSMNDTTLALVAPYGITTNSTIIGSLRSNGILYADYGINATGSISTTGNIYTENGTITGGNMTINQNMSVSGTINNVSSSDWLRKSECVLYIEATSRTSTITFGTTLYTSVYHIPVNLVRSEYNRPQIQWKLETFSSGNTNSIYSFGFFKVIYDQYRALFTHIIEDPNSADYTLSSNFDGQGSSKVIITIVSQNTPTHINVNIA